MSNARPMSDGARLMAYDSHKTGLFTARQCRQMYRMEYRRHLRDLGDLPASGATGLRVRKPLRSVKSGAK